MLKSIQFTFSDGTKQVLNPTASFFSHKEVETDYKSWKNGKHPQRVLTLEERIQRIANDLKAVSYKLIGG